MGIAKNILHNDYTPDDEKLPGRTVSIKTQEYPIAVKNGGTGASTAAAARNNLGVPEYKTGTWTAYIFDNNTKVMEIPNQRFFRIGNILIMELAVSDFTPTSAISTMLQVRNLPATTVMGGQVCIAGLNGAAGNTTVQGMKANWAYIHPKVTLTKGTNYGWFTGVFFGTI